MPHWKQPTPGQIEAGNYYKPRLKFQGIDVAVENPAGTVRSGEGWRTKMEHHYGYFPGTKGRDGDAIDTYIGPHEKAPKAYVVHQRTYGNWKKWDEDKVMLGFRNKREAVKAFLRHYDDRRFLGPVSTLKVEELKKRLVEGARSLIRRAR
jgi:hypothetical protein